MRLEDLSDKKIGILGFGQEGQAVLSYFQKHGLAATVYDENNVDEKLKGSFSGQSSFVTGPGSFNNLQECQILFRSPGIWRNHPQILTAEKQGTIITSQVKWFFNNCPSKIVGVTGTKGKGTTCSLIYQGIKNEHATSARKTFLTGNIGKLQPFEFLDDLTADDLVVYELSSFQLQDLTVSPHIGICLMVTSDHLNHHAGLEEYHSAKSAISAFQKDTDVCIFNTDYDASTKIGQLGNGSKLAVSAKIKPEFGAFIFDDSIEISIPATANAAEQQFNINCAKRKLRGRHNLENIAAASLALASLGLSADAIAQAVNAFTGLEHRLQFIGEFNGMTFYDDSISTVPETSIAAIKSFTEPIHLFLGGSDKGLDLADLLTCIKETKNIAGITLLGETGAKIKSELESSNQEIKVLGPYTDFRKAIKDTVESSSKGDVILLSPAAASFDMFKSYKDRGEQFNRIVKEMMGNG